MTGLPPQVRVGPLVYRIITDAEEIKRVSDEADTGSGEWDAFSEHDRLVIGINSSKALGAQRRDLVHELLHCCLRLGGVWPDQYADVVAEARGRDGGVNVEEFCIAGLTGALLGVLCDNPALVKWLTEASS